MVSRHRILSRSRDNLNLDYPQVVEDEEDVWYQKDKLYKDHIQEILDKWHQIDDEIWAKVVVLERNRRVAKAYARAPVLTVNGSDDGFDGFRIGLCGFDNPMRDQKTEELRRHIGHGVKIKMDDAGNILIKRISQCNIYVKNTGAPEYEENAIGNDILKLPNYNLEPDKPMKLFDMKKFQLNLNRELRRAYPDRRRLEFQCLSIVSFVKTEQNVLECPIWVLIINIVAMDLLKSKLPPPVVQRVDIKNRPRIPVPDDDEDPYSIAAASASGNQMLVENSYKMSQYNKYPSPRRNEKPPKLPPRENLYVAHNIPKPDYDDITDTEKQSTSSSFMKNFPFTRNKRNKEQQKSNKKYDDPYYCGLRARVPNFVKTKTKEDVINKRHSIAPPPGAAFGSLLPFMPMSTSSKLSRASSSSMLYHYQQQPKSMMWTPRSYDTTTDSSDFSYTNQPIYGRLPMSRSRDFLSSQPKSMYVSEWD